MKKLEVKKSVKPKKKLKVLEKLATAPFDMVSAAGYGCNVFVAFNVGIFDNVGDYDTASSK